MKKSLSKNSVVKVFGKIYLNTLRIIAEKVARHVLFVEKNSPRLKKDEYRII